LRLNAAAITTAPQIARKADLRKSPAREGENTGKHQIVEKAS
jgi:hypothetical protein